MSHASHPSSSSTTSTKRPATVSLRGRVLVLTRDTDLIRAQIAGEDIELPDETALMDNISTDEITPGWVCFYYDETLGRYVYVGLREGPIGPDDVAKGRFDAVVSGLSKGCGSSRETAPYAELYAGIRMVFARSVEKIYEQNCQNIGLLVSTDFGLLERLRAGESVPIEEFTRGLDPISKSIVEFGGLFPYNRARLAGEVAPPPVETGRRPMTLAEKILAAHAVTDARHDRVGLRYVAPGDAFFVRADLRFSHEYVTPMAADLFRRFLGPDARVRDPQTVYAFRDHLTFLGEVISEEHRRMGLLERAQGLATTQADFVREQGIRLYGEVAGEGSEAISHNAVLDDLALPGQVVVGTDSHTCTAGALGCFAFGVGSTDMANAWYTGDVRVRVPETILVRLQGEMPPDVCAKDVMLAVLATEAIRRGDAIGKVLQFMGPAISRMPLEERATLTNMAVEAGAFTGIVEPDEVTVEFLARVRGLDPAQVREHIVRGDPDAQYAGVIELDVGALRPTVARPGDPRQGVPIDEVRDVRIDIAYGGSCTGGKRTDMDLYARVFRPAVERGMRVAPGVRLFIQFGSQGVRRYAESKGYVELFEKVGARILYPSCGACIKAGPGVSQRPDEVSISAINRNFPGRSGPGQVYLGSPLVVAASALAGRIAAPSDLGL